MSVQRRQKSGALPAICGAVAAVGLTGWLQTGFPEPARTLAPAALALAVALPLALAPWFAHWLHRLPPALCGLLVLLAAVVAQAAAGISPALLALSALLGLCAGLAAGLRPGDLAGAGLGLSLGALAVALAREPLLNSSDAAALPFALALERAPLLSSSTAAALPFVAAAALVGCLVPLAERDEQDLAISCAAGLLAFGLWLALGLVCAPLAPGLSPLVWIVCGLLAICVMLALRLLAYAAGEQAWSWLSRRLQSRQLALAIAALDRRPERTNPPQLQALERMYHSVSTGREQLLEEQLARGRPLWRLLAHDPPPRRHLPAPRDELYAEAKRALEGTQLAAALPVLADAVARGGADERIWRVCLPALLARGDWQRARRACHQSNQAGHSAPFHQLLDAAGLAQYDKTIDYLLSRAEKNPPTASRTVALLETELGRRNDARIVSSALALHHLAPERLWYALSAREAAEDGNALQTQRQTDAQRHYGAIVDMLTGHIANNPADEQASKKVVRALVAAVGGATKETAALAAIAMAGLARCAPDKLPKLFAAQRGNGIVPQLGALATSGATWGRDVQTVFRRGLGLPPTWQVKDSELVSQLFPPASPAGDLSAADFHLEEVLGRPAVSVSSARITAWGSPRPDGALDLILAGHGDPAVCRLVTGSLTRMISRRGDGAGQSWMLVLGACWLEGRPPPAGEPDDAAALLAELKPLADETGLVRLSPREGLQHHQAALGELRDKIAGAATKGPQWIISWKGGADETGQPLVLPFYTFGSAGGVQPLTLTLPRAFFGAQLDDLLKKQRTVVGRYVTDDALQRLSVYRQWLQRDTEGVAAHAAALADCVLGGERHSDAERDTLAAAYTRLLTDEQTTRSLAEQTYTWLQQAPRAELLRQRAPWLDMPPVASLEPRELARRIGAAFAQLPADWQDARCLEEIGWLHARMEGQRPPAPTHDLLEPLLRRDLTVRGARDYPLARLEDGTGLAPSSRLQSLLALPLSIQEDRHWIADARKTLEGNETTTKRLDQINGGILIDAFLRGHPPDLLEDAGDRAIYDEWCKQPRKAVWAVIHAELTARGLRVDPLLEPNIVFVVRDDGADKLVIEPRYIADSRTLITLVHPHVGMTWYLTPWDYRRSVLQRPRSHVVNKCAWAQAELRDAMGALAANKPDVAATHLRCALRIQPAWTLRRLLRRAWPVGYRDVNLCLRQGLAEAVERFAIDREPPPAETLNDFIAHFPNFLPDPYLLRAFCDHKQAPELFSATDELRHLAANNPPGPAFGARWQRFLDKTAQLIWLEVYGCDHRDVNDARDIDWDLVKAGKTASGYLRSGGYQRHIEPLIDLRRADAYQELAMWLRERLSTGATFTPDDELRRRLEVEAQNPWLEPEVVQGLIDLHQMGSSIVEHRPIDAIWLHGQARQLLGLLDLQTLRCYERAAAANVTAVARRRLVRQRHASSGYRAALRALIPPQRLPLHSIWPRANASLCNVKLLIVERLEFRAEERTFVVHEPDSTAGTAIARLSSLSDGAAEALAKMIARGEDDLIAAIDNPAAPLRPAYAALYEPLPIPEPLGCWGRTIERLEDAIVVTMALHPLILPLDGTLPPDRRARLWKMLRRYDSQYAHVIEGFETSLALVQQKLMASKRFPADWLPPPPDCGER